MQITAIYMFKDMHCVIKFDLYYRVFHKKVFFINIQNYFLNLCQTPGSE